MKESPLLREIFARRGLLAKVVSGYEWRPQQARMARRVHATLEGGGILFVEAPTGVGKSLAYLVPAALRARRDGPVLVSSYTRALQDQILHQDAPLLRRLVHPDLVVAVLKGRSNYLCRRRWRLFKEQMGSTLDGQAVLQKLEPWVEVTPTGDLAEAPDLGRARWALPRIASDPLFCRSAACRPEEGCFYKAARRRAREAHLVVVNHSLLLADVAASGEVLPEASCLVLDEAHHLVDVAREQLAVSVGSREIAHALREVGGLGEPGATDAARRLVRERVPKASRATWLERLRALERDAATLWRRVEALFREAVARAAPGALPERRRYHRPEDLPLGLEAAEEILSRLGELASALEAVVQELEPREPEGGDERLDRVRGALAGLHEVLAGLRHCVEADDAGRVYAYEMDAEGGLALRSLPLEVGETLRERLLLPREAVVLTSATLSVGGRVEHLAREMGLEAGLYEEEILESPFPLAEQVLALAREGGSGPNGADYAEEVARSVAALARSVPRKMLVLFTSHDLLGRVAATLRDAVEGVEILEQGRGSGEGRRLGETFREASRGILLGTASFWEGVDFPGEDLEILVLTRLPFAVPTDPLEEALMERIRDRGGDPFRDRTLPQAILRFRQGFGRLIRRRRDRGVFVVLDPRLLGARYGRLFQEAVGVSFRRFRAVEELEGLVSGWFEASG
jgi:predicted DnaQ family exonuclease/DinG family helicase